MTAPTQYKGDDLREYFYKESERVFIQFPKYRANILLRCFNTKLKKENIFT
jgi:hypothetical protein